MGRSASNSADVAANAETTQGGWVNDAGLALGSASFLWIMAGLFNYDTKLPDAAQAVQGCCVCSGIVVAILFGVCTLLLITYH